MRDDIRDLAGFLGANGALKLWSVLVTCLGDLSQSGTAEVSGLALSALVDRIGLQPQAMRVALHRLKRDGWTESRRDGRVGFHRLTDSALVQTRAVAARIYGPGVAGEAWHLAGMPLNVSDGLDLLPDTLSAVPISRSFAVICGPLRDVPDDWLITEPTDRRLPDWVREVLAEAACETGFKALEAALARLGSAPADPLDRFALRVLVLHGWRRLVLRSNPAAEAALGAERAEVSCRAQVHGLLSALGPAVIPDPQVVS